jgi:hypothetical protein
MLIYATCENKPAKYTKKKGGKGTKGVKMKNPLLEEEISEDHSYVEVNLKNPKEMVDLMGKKIFKNIAEEFFGCSDNLQQDYGLEVTLFESDFFMDDTMEFLENFSKSNSHK